MSREVVESLAAWNGSSSAAAPPTDATFWLTRDLGVLRDGLSRLDEQALRLRKSTGLETLPKPAAVEAPPLAGRAWLGWLEQQEEFAGLGLLAKRLLAAIHIPRNLNEPEELPLGGITDIAPRGPLDRLLLSELAHDDLTLSVRVAMNEALYLRRESPPRTPPHQRHILLDAGLRLWGIPRVYATAVALAMTAHGDPHLNVQVYRPAGSELESVVMNTADGLRNHLAALDHRLHPGDSLRRLVDLLEESEGGDAVVVTSDDTLSDPAFQRALEHSAIGSVYFASVSRDGRFELLHRSPAGRKRISKAQLPLDEILGSPRRPAAQLRDADKAPLPAIFRAEPFPLLLPVSVTIDNSWLVHERDLLTLAGDGRLLRWNIHTRGAEQLATGLPAGRIFGVTAPPNSDDPIWVVLGRLSPRGLYAVRVNRNGTVETAEPRLPTVTHIQRVLVDKTVAYVATRDRVLAVELASSAHPAIDVTSPHALMVGRHGLVYARLYRDRFAWHRVVLRNRRVDYEFVCPNQLLCMFDVRGIEGPVGITPQGDIFFSSKGETKTVNHGLPLPVRCVQVSRDGLRFILQHGERHKLVNTVTGSVVDCISTLIIERHLDLFARPRNLRNRFQGVGVDSLGNLSLITADKKSWRLQMPSLTFPTNATHTPGVIGQLFQLWKHSDVAGFKLQRATFPDGSVAVLDSRGLLHLRSADANIPECTIVLCEGPTAGWCADGRMWGPKYFLGSRFEKATPAETIARDVIAPFLERLR